MSTADKPQTFSRPEHNLCFTENKILFKYFYIFPFINKNIKTLWNKYHYVLIKLKIHGHSFILSIRHKLCSGLEKVWGLSAVLMLIFTRFKFDSAIYRNFFSFRV